MNTKTNTDCQKSALTQPAAAGADDRCSSDYPKTNPQLITSCTSSIAEASGQPINTDYSSGCSLPSLPLTVTRITAARPESLTKAFTLDAGGKLTKFSIANLFAGTCQRETLDDLPAFIAFLEGLHSNQAVTYGVPKGRDQARLVTEAECTHHPEAISRTRRCFEFAASPGMFMLDHDPSEDQALAPEELIGFIRGLTPCLSTVAMVWRASASSGIRSADGILDTGIAGQRLYLPVVDARLIPEAGQALIYLLWAKGHGYIKIGKAGQALERTLVDASVWQPERLDFAAPRCWARACYGKPPLA